MRYYNMNTSTKKDKVIKEEASDMIKMGYAEYIIPSTTPWVTSKKLKRTPPSKEEIERAIYIDTHNFDIELTNGKVLVKVTEK